MHSVLINLNYHIRLNWSRNDIGLWVDKIRKYFSQYYLHIIISKIIISLKQYTAHFSFKNYLWLNV